MDVLKIANLQFNKNIEFLHTAMEPIIAFSVVFGVSDGNITKVYTSQNAAFDNGTPWVMGIAQNNAQIGETVEVQYFGLSKVRFYSRNVPANQFIYLLNDSNGVCCLSNEDGIETFKRNEKSIMIGNVLPRTQPVADSTLEPREMLVDCYINIDSSSETTTIVLTQEGPTLVEQQGDETYYRMSVRGTRGDSYSMRIHVVSFADTQIYDAFLTSNDGQITATGATGVGSIDVGLRDWFSLAITGATGAFNEASGEIEGTKTLNGNYVFRMWVS